MASRPDVPLPPPVSVEGKLAELDNVPLFMRSLPDDVSSNETVEALQSLIYEDPPNGMHIVVQIYLTEMTNG
jgi:hypothetical protein